jgi:hypothetical protein
MLLLPSTVLVNFWAAKLTSLVAFEQLKVPNVVGSPGGARRLEAGDRPVEGLVPARRAERAALRVADEGWVSRT